MKTWIQNRETDRAMTSALAVGVCLRLWVLLQDRSFWMDEAAYFNELRHRSFAEILTGPWNPIMTAQPLFNVVAKIWAALCGANEILLRLLPFMFGILALFVAARLLNRVLNSIQNFWLVLLLAVNPVLIFYSTEFKHYSFEFLFFVFGFAVWESPQSSRFLKLKWSYLILAPWLSISCSVLAAAALFTELCVLKRSESKRILSQGLALGASSFIFIGLFLFPNLKDLYLIQNFYQDYPQSFPLLTFFNQEFYVYEKLALGWLAVLTAGLGGYQLYKRNRFALSMIIVTLAIVLVLYLLELWTMPGNHLRDQRSLICFYFFTAILYSSLLADWKRYPIPITVSTAVLAFWFGIPSMTKFNLLSHSEKRQLASVINEIQTAQYDHLYLSPSVAQVFYFYHPELLSDDRVIALDTTPFPFCRDHLNCRAISREQKGQAMLCAYRVELTDQIKGLFDRAKFDASLVAIGKRMGEDLSARLFPGSSSADLLSFQCFSTL